MNKTLSKKGILLLIISGLIATTISFIYYFAFKNPFKLVLYFILIIDLVLFFINVYRLSLSFNKSKLKTIRNNRLKIIKGHSKKVKFKNIESIPIIIDSYLLNMKKTIIVFLKNNFIVKI